MTTCQMTENTLPPTRLVDCQIGTKNLKIQSVENVDRDRSWSHKFMLLFQVLVSNITEHFICFLVSNQDVGINQEAGHV